MLGKDLGQVLVNGLGGESLFPTGGLCAALQSLPESKFSIHSLTGCVLNGSSTLRRQQRAALSQQMTGTLKQV